MTGSLDEVAIKAIIDLDKSLTNLNNRKEAVLAKIQEQGKLTKELEEAILAAEKLADVEELYLPYKEKRRTKATIAREAGLFPLARLILQNVADLEKEAEKLSVKDLRLVRRPWLVQLISWSKPYRRMSIYAL